MLYVIQNIVTGVGLFVILQTDDSTALCQMACNILNSLLLHLKSSESGHQFATGLLPAILTEIMQKLKDKVCTKVKFYV